MGLLFVGRTVVGLHPVGPTVVGLHSEELPVEMLLFMGPTVVRLLFVGASCREGASWGLHCWRVAIYGYYRSHRPRLPMSSE